MGKVELGSGGATRVDLTISLVMSGLLGQHWRAGTTSVRAAQAGHLKIIIIIIK